MSTTGTVYLIPSVLDEQGYASIPLDVMDAIEHCQVFFVENERTARRYIMQLWRTHPSEKRTFVIDEHEWHTIHKAEPEVMAEFESRLKSGKNIGIISEAGCPGIADPGQLLVARAQELGARIRPLVGPSSILLSLMASGMNGQSFRFLGYLPIDAQERAREIKEMESESNRRHCTQIFIETPYRNNQLLEALLRNCHPGTRICIAGDITGEKESIRTRSVAEWKKNVPELHKRPVIFLLHAG